MVSHKDFVNILKERRLSSDILWASREWIAASAYNSLNIYSPSEIKSIVLYSQRLNKLLQTIQNEKNVPPNELYLAVTRILNEIGYDRKVPILRWLGFFVSKILKKLLLGVYVNESKFLKIKSEMGSNPLIFVPSHKSYCDFILMSYICFNYEVDIPRIAAGMDFQSMAVMGDVLRDACAFFMRRSFTNDELYSGVFSQYVHTLVVYGDAPIEFFIEGTRSRTQKSLMPKYGFLSMSLKPFFVGLVPDVTIVPVNLSYDRVLEEVLFAYELLGVPKPKESTKGFLKALSILNENYGNIYVQFGDPMSVKKYFGSKIDRSIHNSGSVDMQELTTAEIKCIEDLAHTIVQKQKELTMLSSFNLIAAVVNNYLYEESDLYLDNLIEETKWLFDIFRVLAPNALSINEITAEIVLDYLKLHKSVLTLDKNNIIQISKIHLTHSNGDLKNLKGHELSNSTMDCAVPILLLQYYVNPCSSFIIGVCFIAFIMHLKKNLPTDELFKNFQFFCSIFSYEFAICNNFIEKEFTEALSHCQYFGVVDKTNDDILVGNNQKLLSFCVNFLNSFIPGYVTLLEVLQQSVDKVLTQKEVYKLCQMRIELKLGEKEAVHPANLSLDLYSNCLQSLTSMKVVVKNKRENELIYQADEEELKRIYSELKNYDSSIIYNRKINELSSVCIKASL